jgi:hypothetical protein
MRAAVFCVCPPGALADPPLAIPTLPSGARRAWRTPRRMRASPRPASKPPARLLRALILCPTCIPLARQALCPTAPPRHGQGGARTESLEALAGASVADADAQPAHCQGLMPCTGAHGTHEAGAPSRLCCSTMRASRRAPARAGSTQDSTRVWRALALGCIPVTFFRAAELPFARRLGLDYTRFTVNIQPDDYRGVQACARALRVAPMRRALGTPGGVLSSCLSQRVMSCKHTQKARETDQSACQLIDHPQPTRMDVWSSLAENVMALHRTKRRAACLRPKRRRPSGAPGAAGGAAGGARASPRAAGGRSAPPGARLPSSLLLQ